jgi:hypothetical protein
LLRLWPQGSDLLTSKLSSSSLCTPGAHCFLRQNKTHLWTLSLMFQERGMIRKQGNAPWVNDSPYSTCATALVLIPTKRKGKSHTTLSHFVVMSFCFSSRGTEKKTKPACDLFFWTMSTKELKMFYVFEQTKIKVMM